MPTTRTEDRLYELVGLRIRERREGRFTQEELADLVSASRTSITNLECGRQRPPLHLLLRIAEALECELRDLLPNRSELGFEPGGASAMDNVRVFGDLTPATVELLHRYVQREESVDGE